eukprot:364996-Chlamydomonas_euryale.AAC.1
MEANLCTLNLAERLIPGCLTHVTRATPARPTPCAQRPARVPFRPQGGAVPRPQGVRRLWRADCEAAARRGGPHNPVFPRGDVHQGQRSAAAQKVQPRQRCSRCMSLGAVLSGLVVL